MASNFDVCVQGDWNPENVKCFPGTKNPEIVPLANFWLPKRVRVTKIFVSVVNSPHPPLFFLHVNILDRVLPETADLAGFS